MFSSHWFSNRSSYIYFCGISWPLSFPPSLIRQFPRHDHASIHLNRIQSPWNCKHHISSKCRDQLMNIHGVITQKTPIWSTSTTTRGTPALPTRVYTPTNAHFCSVLAQSVRILAALKLVSFTRDENTCVYIYIYIYIYIYTHTHIFHNHFACQKWKYTRRFLCTTAEELYNHVRTALV